MAYQYPTIASQLAAMSERESPKYRRGVAQMTKVKSQDFLIPDDIRRQYEDAEAIRKNEEFRLANRPGKIRDALMAMNSGQAPSAPAAKPSGPASPAYASDDMESRRTSSGYGLSASAPASTQPSFLSQVGNAFGSVAPDLFRGIAAGLASYDGNPLTPYSGVGEAMAATMQRSEQTREARRKMSLAGEEGAAAAQMEAGFEREMNKQNMGDFRGMAQPSEDDRRYFDDLVKMEGFKIGVPSSGVNKAMLAYTAANPFSATERERMEADMRRNLQSALRISF